MDEEINANLKQLSTWKRIFFMLIFSVISELVKILLWAVIVLQVASALLTGKPNQNILNFGRSLSLYTYHILLFLTFSTEIIPFPFSDWNQTAGLQLPETELPKE
jgi:hypothetical protein